MTFGALVSQGARAVARHTTRSALTIFGIAVGIAAVVWVVAVGAAGSARANAQLQKLGDNLVWVEAGARNVNGARTGNLGAKTLTVGDAEAIANEIQLVRSVSPQVDGTMLAVRGELNWTTRYRGVAPSYLVIKRWEIAEGAAFTDEDVAQTANVCILGATVRKQLFGEDDPVGRIVRVGVHPFEVLGVLAAKGQTAEGRDQDDTVFVPYTTAMTKLRGQGQRWVDDIVCSALSADVVERATAEIISLVRERHSLGPGYEDDFNIRRPEELIKAQVDASKTLELLLLSVASVALLVGGIGTMNVMLASVTERTREIGVRLAVGTKGRAVRAQFLIEAVTLCAVGGTLGIALSVGGSFAISRFLGWELEIPLHAFGTAILFSITVGVCAGFYPAWRASRLDPTPPLRRTLGEPSLPSIDREGALRA